MRIYQLVNTLVQHDGIGNEVFAMHDIIKKYDDNTRIFACNIDHNIKSNTVFSVNEIPKLDKNDVVIYHLCESSSIETIIKKFHCKKIAIYHNTTPSHFFEGIDVEFTFNQKFAVNDIKELNKTFDICIADSEFNRQDLIKMGYDGEKIVVMPLIIPTNDYIDNNTVKYYDDDYVNILFVGRIVPNKKQNDIIRIFAYYKKYINKKSRLILVGKPFTKQYYLALKQYIKDLEVEDVVIKSNVDFNEIKQIYKSAHIFLCMSEHEGFCIPLVEAMLFDVPIIAYKSSAVVETIGPGGFVIDTKDPFIVSKVIENILMNKELNSEIIKCQRERVKFYDYNLSVNRFQTILDKFLNSK